MRFTDTHCHLDFPDYDQDREAVLASAAQRGVRRLLVPGFSAARWQAAPQGVIQDVRLVRALGLHPYCLDDHEDDHLVQLDSGLRQRDASVVAVGEIGLHKPAGNMARQVDLLESQLELARCHDLPVILHQHGAHNEMIRSLKRVPPKAGGVVHAFAGSREMAEAYHAMGLFLGLGGVITYPRAAKTRRAVAAMPLEALLLETDGPDMPLCGYQGRRNTPAQIPAVFRALCAVSGISDRSAAARQLEHNADRLLGA